jgi:hypothetical protein
MNPERLDELLWELIDGEINPEDHTILREYLVGRPEAEERRREFVALATKLGSQERVEPPAELRERINAALDAVPAPVVAAPPAVVKMPPPRAATWPMRASYLAAGLLLGVGLTFLVVGGAGQDLDQSKLYGTVQLPLEEAVSVELEADAGTLVFDRSGTRRTLDLDLRWDGVVEVKLDSQSGVIKLETVDHVGSTALAASTEGPRLLLTMQGPAALRLVVDVGVPDASLLVTITAEDEALGIVHLFAGEISNVQ